MNIHNYHTFTPAFLAFVIMTFILSGCASTGLERSEKVQTTMETVNDDITEAAKQLEATETSLETLMSPGQTDIEKAFQSFTENLSQLENTKESLTSHAEEMQEHGNEYFQEWEKEGDEYDNSKIQQLSEERRNELENMYDRVTERSIKVSEVLDSYVSEVKEIQSYLSNDLTKKGIAGVAPTSRKVANEGETLKQAILNVQSAIQKTRSEMSTEGIN